MKRPFQAHVSVFMRLWRINEPFDVILALRWTCDLCTVSRVDVTHIKLVLKIEEGLAEARGQIKER